MVLDNFRAQQITWDKASRKIYEDIRANESDARGRKLVVQVTNDGVVETLSGVTLILRWKSKNGTGKGYDNFTVLDASKGLFELYYTTGMLSNVGVLEAFLELNDATGRVISEPFNITVTRGVDDSAIEGSDSFTALAEAMATVNAIHKKVGGGVKAKLEDLSPEVLSAIDGSGGPFNLLSIPQEKSVGVKETKYLMAEGEPSKNLFNKTTVTSGYYVSVADGKPRASGSYNISDWISVQPNTDYILTRFNNTGNDIAFYSAPNEDSFISGIGVATNYFTTPSTCRFVRLSVANIFLDLQQLEVGRIRTPYASGFPTTRFSKEEKETLKNGNLQYSFISEATIGGSGANSGFVDYENKKIIRRTGTPIGTGTSAGSEIYFSQYLDGGLLAGDKIRIFFLLEVSAGMFPRGTSDFSMRMHATEAGVMRTNIQKDLVKKSLSSTQYLASVEYDVINASESFRAYLTLENVDVPTTDQNVFVRRAYYEIISSNTMTGSTKILEEKLGSRKTELFNNQKTDATVTISTIGKRTLYLHVKDIYNVAIRAKVKNREKGTYHTVSATSCMTGVDNNAVATRGIFQVDVSNYESVQLVATMSAETSSVSADYSFDFVPSIPYQISRNSVVFNEKATRLKELTRIMVQEYKNGVIYANSEVSPMKTLKKSTNEGVSFIDVYTFEDDIDRVLVLDNGNIMVLLSTGKIYLSENEGASFKLVASFDGEKPHKYFGFSHYKNIVAIAPYAVRSAGSDKGKKALISTDNGNTFKEVFSLLNYPELNGPASHIHSIAYDPYEKMLWICAGDGQASQMVYYSKDMGKTWYKSAPQGKLEFQPTVIIPLRNSVLFVSDTRLVGVVRYMRPIGGTKEGSELHFDQPLIVSEKWGSGVMDVPIASVPVIDYEKSVAYFSWILTTNGHPGRDTAIGSMLNLGEVYTTNGDTFELCYQRPIEMKQNVNGIYGDGNKILSKVVQPNYNADLLDVSKVWG